MTKRMAQVALLAVALLVLSVAPAGATNFFVPGTHATIQSALNVAGSGDAVVVSAGTYSENVVMKLGVQLIGAGPEFSTIDGGGVYSAVSVPYGATHSTRIEGFTIQNGSNETGGGIRIQSGSSPTVTNCLIRGNHASARGGGIYIDNQCSPVIEFCTIQDNHADEGGGIYVQTSTPVIRWNVICHNSALVLGGGVHIAFAQGATVEHNSIALNSVEMDFGAGISFANCMATVQYNIIALNSGSAGLWASGSALTNDCNIVWGNSEGDYFGVTPGENSLSVDPMFCDAENCDLSVSGSSPALNADGCGLIGALTAGCDFTATENTTWGEIKSKYR